MLSKQKRQEILTALDSNPNANQVAKAVGGVSRVTVWNLAKEVGIELGKPGSPITPEKRQEILTALESNPNANQVTKTVGDVSVRTVWKLAKEVGIELGKPGSPITPEKRQEILTALESNPNANQVTKTVGDVSVRTVWKLAKEVGIELGKPGRPKVDRQTIMPPATSSQTDPK